MVNRSYFAFTTLIICVLVFMAVIVPQSKVSEYADRSGWVKDFLGREVAPPVIRPQRIISLSPGNTEIIFALGAGNRLVGVTTYCDYPEEAKKITKVGSFEKPDIEKIILLRPDIVFTGGEFHTGAIRALENAGIQVVAIEPRSIEDVLKSIRLIASFIHEQENGESLIAGMEQILVKVRNSASETSKKIFVEIWDKPLLTVGGTSYINDIITQAGGRNVAAAKAAYYAVCDNETLYAYDPDIYIVARHGGTQRKRMFSRFEQENIRAIRENRVYYISDDYMDRPGPRSFIALEQIADIIRQESKKNQGLTYHDYNSRIQ
ncbi:Vitamin B12-binding protein [Sporomusa carbonis]|uniref:ABC transporter substrate-binding protein n=1 Tax=Sporomusa carbonis TaxID=3076075 RepID=UPI003A6A5B1D